VKKARECEKLAQGCYAVLSPMIIDAHELMTANGNSGKLYIAICQKIFLFGKEISKCRNFVVLVTNFLTDKLLTPADNVKCARDEDPLSPVSRATSLCNLARCCSCINKTSAIHGGVS